MLEQPSLILSDIERRLKNNGGYIKSSEIDEYVEEFGGDFEVCVKFYEHPRQLMTLDDLRMLKASECEEADDIRDVFITWEKFREMFCLYPRM